MRELPGESGYVRAFAGIEVDNATRSALSDTQNALRRTECHVGWVPAPNLHLSLAFLGNIARDSIGPASDALDEAAASVTAFSCEVSGVGTFGSSRSPRVVWAGVEAVPPLMELQRRVADLLPAVGLPIEKREYRPHVTLGRVRSSRGRDALVSAVVALREQRFGVIVAERVCLFQSILGPAGAKYSLLHEAPLMNHPRER